MLLQRDFLAHYLLGKNLSFKAKSIRNVVPTAFDIDWMNPDNVVDGGIY